MAEHDEQAPETKAEREARVEAAEADRTRRDKAAPLTGVLTSHDVLRHLVRYGPPAGAGERAELLAVIDAGDPDVEDVPGDQDEQPRFDPRTGKPVQREDEK